MKQLNKTDNNKTIVILIFIVVIIVMNIYLMSSFNLLAPDEYNYSNISSGTERVTSIFDIFTTQKNLYNNWTGRILVHRTYTIFFTYRKTFI
ncbi:MAG: DUF6056 family protein [Clostridia bacterium]